MKLHFAAGMRWGIFAAALLAASLPALDAPPSYAGGPTNGAMAVDCDANAAGVQSACAVRSGATFSVQVWITEAPSPSGYFLFQAKLRWTDSVVSYLPTEDYADEALWPDCDVPARLINVPSGDPSVVFGCVPFPMPLQGSTFTGAALLFQFRCSSSLPPPGPNQAALTLVPRPDDEQQGSQFLDGDFGSIDPALTNATVTCRTDADADGCDDYQELANDPRSGGDRNPGNFWDFFDTPDLSNLRDRSITAADIARVVERFGSNDLGAPFGSFDRTSDPLSRPNAPISPPGARGNYHPAFDRSSSPPKLSGPADGIIATGDIAMSVAQFGHSCATPSAS